MAAAINKYPANTRRLLTMRKILFVLAVLGSIIAVAGCTGTNTGS